MNNIKNDTYYGLKGAFLALKTSILGIVAIYGTTDQGFSAVPIFVWIGAALMVAEGYLFGRHAKNSIPDDMEKQIAALKEERDAWKNTSAIPVQQVPIERTPVASDSSKILEQIETIVKQRGK